MCPKMHLLGFLLTCVITCVTAKIYEDCGSTADVTNVDVLNCKEGAECPLVRGESTKVNITFTPKKDIAHLKAVVHGKIFGVFIPFLPPQIDACVNSGLDCPVSAGKEVKYHSEIPVLKSYPPLEVTVRWQLKEDKDTIVCILIKSVLV